MGSNLPVRQWIMVPAIVTLAITLLRLAGELMDWSAVLFKGQPGGGGAIVGISWLIIVFGIYFGFKLAKGGHMPKSLWMPVVVFLVSVIAQVLVFTLLGLAQIDIAIIFIISAVICWLAVLWFKKVWPEAGSVLLTYALAARIPVAIVMLFAIYGSWGTHYDFLPPEAGSLADASPFFRWFAIGLIPQLSTWIFATVVGGGLLSTITAAIVGRKK